MASEPKRVIADLSDFSDPAVRAWNPIDPNPAEELAKARKAKGIPPHYWKALDALEETPVTAAVRAFMAKGDPRTFLVLAGTPGTGKAVAACLGLELHLGKPVAYVADGQRYEYLGPDLPGWFAKASDLGTGLFDRELWDSTAAAPRLVVDDLGLEVVAGNGREQFLSRLGALLHERYDYERKTIVTCNLTREVFAATYLEHDGGRLADRFREVGWFQVVTGTSRRKPLAQRPDASDGGAP